MSSHIDIVRIRDKMNPFLKYGIVNTVITIVVIFFIMLILVFIDPSIFDTNENINENTMDNILFEENPEVNLNDEDEKDFDENYSVWHSNRGFTNDDPSLYDLYDNSKND